ncbi:hypothetical protein ARMSODRAFT_980952 [Armillaria solidipes]|uniref:Uncharacterized protein n=1 Tax=Armillaria solidipes TaxID=1076256 RepID=A0A2H3BGK1_9AGAR|nr:hypothetical protein ARMSODRAFT_980952 [Armillaria solidipes]
MSVSKSSTLKAVKTSLSNIRGRVGPKATPPSVSSRTSPDVGAMRPHSSSFSLQPGELMDTSPRPLDHTPIPSSTLPSYDADFIPLSALPSSLYDEGQIPDSQPPEFLAVDDNNDIPDLMALLEAINIQAGPPSDTCLMFSDTFHQSAQFLKAIMEAARIGRIDEFSNVENIQKLYQHISTTGAILKFLMFVADHMAHLESTQRVALEWKVRHNWHLVVQWLSHKLEMLAPLAYPDRMS